jgi:hypothetical protein
MVLIKSHSFTPCQLHVLCVCEGTSALPFSLHSNHTHLLAAHNHDRRAPSSGPLHPLSQGLECSFSTYLLLLPLPQLFTMSHVSEAAAETLHLAVDPAFSAHNVLSPHSTVCLSPRERPRCSHLLCSLLYLSI